MCRYLSWPNNCNLVNEVLISVCLVDQAPQYGNVCLYVPRLLVHGDTLQVIAERCVKFTLHKSFASTIALKEA